LENKDRWAEVIAHTQGTGFDPYLAVLRSSYLALRRLFQMGRDPSGHSWQQIATRAMIHASFADRHRESHEAQTKILEEINGLMTSSLGHNYLWFNHLEKVLVERRVVHSFLDFALFLNLSSYVSYRLRQHISGTQKIATELLRRRVIESRFQKPQITPFQSPEMTTALILLGADMNAKNTSPFTTWEILLNQAVATPSGPPREFLPIMKIFLESGANPRASVFQQGQKISVRRFLSQFLAQYYPAEAANLLFELDRALGLNKIDSLGKKDEEGHICFQSMNAEIVCLAHCSPLSLDLNEAFKQFL
jgi:hypothetical protein